MSAVFTALSESNHPEDEEHLARLLWLEERRKGVGASEVAAILGLDPWKTALGVWASKVHGDETIDSEVMEIGRELEEPGARMFARRFPDLVVQDPGMYTIRRHRNAPLFATCDRDLETRGPAHENDRGVLEIKASSKTDEWTGGPPLRYVCQVQAQLAVTGRTWGYLAALLGGRKFVAHRIERDDAFIDAMLDKVREFWSLVESKTEPDATKPFDLSVVKLLHPKDSGTTIEADAAGEAFVAAWESATKAKREAEESHKLTEAALRQHVGDATWMALPDGRKVQAKVEPRKAECCKQCGGIVREASEPRVLRVVKAGRK